MTGHPQGFSRRSRRDRSTGAMTCCPTRGNLPWERGGVGRTGRGASPAAQAVPGASDAQTMSNLIVIGIGLCMRLLHRPPPASPRDHACSPCRPLQSPPGRTWDLDANAQGNCSPRAPWHARGFRRRRLNDMSCQATYRRRDD